MSLGKIKILELEEGVMIFQDWLLFVNPDGTHKKGKVADVVKQGWTPILGVVADGERRVVAITEWVGGFGETPGLGYLGDTGIVADVAEATDVRGDKGTSVETVEPTPDWKLDFSFSEGPNQLVDLGLAGFKQSIETTAQQVADNASTVNTQTGEVQTNTEIVVNAVSDALSIYGSAAALEQAVTDATSAKNDATTAKNDAIAAKNDAIAAKWFPVIAEATAARTLTADDAGKEIRCTFATAINITVPPQSSVTWADHTEIILVQAGAGQITLVPGAGVTINSSETLKTAKQYSYVALKRVALNVWDLTGERQIA